MDYIIVALFLMLVIVVIPFVFKQLFIQEKIKDEPKIVNSLKKIYPNLKTIGLPTKNGGEWTINFNALKNNGIFYIECIINPDDYSKLLSEVFFKKVGLFPNDTKLPFLTKTYYNNGFLKSEETINYEDKKSEQKFYYQNGKIERIWKWNHLVMNSSEMSFPGKMLSAECWDKDGNKIQCN